MHFGDQVMQYHLTLKTDIRLQKPVEWIYPYDDPATQFAMKSFYAAFYADQNPRTFILGINPGRFGAGVTGVPFTDPIRLEKIGIPNSFPKKQELSSVFMYEMIDRCGIPEAFFARFYIASLCPLGLMKNGTNYNYYDDPVTLKVLEPFIVKNIETQRTFGCNSEKVFCLGQGKNYDNLKKLNDQHQWWKRVVPLPHPRWIMQYKLKRKEEFLEMFKSNLQ